MKNVQHPWHGVSPGNKGPQIVNALIEIPKGSRAKYEIEKTSGLLKLDRVIYSSFHYPANLISLYCVLNPFNHYA